MSGYSIGIFNELNNEVEFNDTLFTYISQSFNWITGVWSDGIRRVGVDEFGPTIIDTDVKKLRDIFYSWKELFKHATDKFTIVEGLDLNTEEFIEETLEREIVISTLESIINLCDEAISNKQTICIYGI